jgi:hypothetical protein
MFYLQFLSCFQKMRLFQKNLEDLSSRISAAEAIKNSWQGPSETAEVGEMLEQLQVRPDTSLLQPQIVTWSGYQTCFIFRRSTAQKLAIVTETFHGFTQFHQEC